MKGLFFWSKSRDLRTVFTIEKEARRWYLVGTAHFFPYSFERALTRLLGRVETAIFEGPLDDASMQRVADYGKTGSNPLAAMLSAETIREINRQLARRVDGRSEGDLYSLFLPKPDYFEMHTRGVRAWLAFFSIWTTFLQWEYSVDKEAYRVAQKMGKRVRTLETIDEQLQVLDGISLDRIVTQLSEIGQWQAYAARYTQLYLAGDVEELLAMSGRFPTRGPVVINERDVTLFRRMQAIFERECAAAFVGIPHVPGVSRMFREAGYTVAQGVA